MLVPSDPLLPPEKIGSFDGVILDVREPAAFVQKRVAGAVRAPIEVWEAAAKSPSTSLGNISFWESEIGKLGLDGSRPIAIYDEGRMTEAARVWFLVTHFGATAQVIDGGWRAIQRASAPLEAGAVRKISPVKFTANVTHGPVGLVERSELASDLGGGVRVLDARTPAEYSGADLRKNARGGHLPGATHLSHVDLLRADGRVKPADELRSVLESAGFQRSDRIVTHCDGGGRAALAALAAVRAGYTNVSAYYLSFADWAKDESCPVVQD